MKIMVVDDSMMVRQQVAKALGAAGFEVIAAADGIQGLEQLAAHPDIAALVCDINMPRMNGLELLERVPKTLPVVMLTTEGQRGALQEAKVLGARGWLVKPFKPEHLVATIHKLTMAA